MIDRITIKLKVLAMVATAQVMILRDPANADLWTELRRVLDKVASRY
jgi:hypothetical protein